MFKNRLRTNRPACYNTHIAPGKLRPKPEADPSDRVLILWFEDGAFVQIPVTDNTIFGVGEERSPGIVNRFALKDCDGMMILNADDDLVDVLSDQRAAATESER